MLRVVHVGDPFQVLFHPVRGQTKRLDVTLGKGFGQLGGATDFGGADGCEVGRMAKQYDPFTLIIVGEMNIALCGYYCKRRSRITNAWHTDFVLEIYFVEHKK